jgi:putative ABC transport system ATP-binding protein
MTLLQRLNAEGMTILLVTHESDIAGYAERIVELRDGRILRDQRVAGRQMVV